MIKSLAHCIADLFELIGIASFIGALLLWLGAL
jgi:hypothetical protein